MTQYVCLFFFAVVVLSFFFAVWMGTGIFDLIRLLSIYASSSLDDGFNLLCALLGFRLLGYFRRCAAGCCAPDYYIFRLFISFLLLLMMTTRTRAL
jgi:hypothetical protein